MRKVMNIIDNPSPLPMTRVLTLGSFHIGLSNSRIWTLFFKRKTNSTVAADDWT